MVYFLDNLLSDEDRYKEYDRISKLCEDVIYWLVDEKTSIRRAAKELGMSKSAVHRLVHTWIRYNYDEEYQQIRQLFRFNKRYRFCQYSLWYRAGRPW